MTSTTIKPAIPASPQFRKDVLVISAFLAMGALTAANLMSIEVFRSNISGFAMGIGVGYAMRAFVFKNKKGGEAQEAQ